MKKLSQVVVFVCLSSVSVGAFAGECEQRAGSAVARLIADGLVQASAEEGARAALVEVLCPVATTPAKAKDQILGVEIKPAEAGSKGHERLRKKR